MGNFEQKTLASLSIVKNLAGRLGGGTIKSLGQNFLVNQKTLLRFINLLKITKEDIVIEIGAGIGVVSYTLCEQAKKVYLIEIDRTKEEALTKVLENYDNFEIIWADATDFDFSTIDLEGKQAKVIGSLPYNVCKKIIYNLFLSKLDWSEAAFILQKEVAESYASLPPRADFLGTFASIFTDKEFRFKIRASDFFPIPRVESATILFKRNDQYKHLDRRDFSAFIKNGYSSPRKKAFNNMNMKEKGAEIAEKFGINPNARPSELRVEDWEKFFVGSKE
jgi:16S rRNA (adenine1518-N6/adenine1519-N6)-dimethyltransferase